MKTIVILIIVLLIELLLGILIGFTIGYIKGSNDNKVNHLGIKKNKHLKL